MYCAILDRKQAFLDYKNITIFPKVSVKNVKFPHPFFLGKTGLGKVFGAVLDWKEAILGNKNINLKRKLHNWHFSKGVSQWFWSKIKKVKKCFFLVKIE